MPKTAQQSSPPIHKNLPLFLSGLSFLFIILRLSSIFLLQPTLETQNLDVRKAGSVSNGQVVLSSQFYDVTASDSSAHIALSANTNGVQTDGIQVVFNVITNTTDNLAINVSL